MNKEELYLIYINKLGSNWANDLIYEFIFSNTLENIDGEDWDAYPASSGNPKPPSKKFIQAVGVLTTDLQLDVIQHNPLFSVWDAIDGVIALGWENLNEYDIYPDYRLKFKYGETMENVEKILYERDYKLEYKIKPNE